MIQFNDIFLDYKKGGLFPLEIVKSLGEIQTLSERKGTSSKTFELPATPTNNKAFSNLWVDGSTITTLSGQCRIYNDSLIYSVGTLYVQGISKNGNPIKYSCTYQGNDIDFVRSIKDKSLRDLDLGILERNDTNIKNNLGNKTNYLANGYIWSHTQISGVASNSLANSSNLGLYYSLPKLVYKILEDYEVESNILDSDYLENKVIGSFGAQENEFYTFEKRDSNTLLFETGATGTPPTLEKNIRAGFLLPSSNTLLLNNLNEYELNRDCTFIKLNFNLNIDLTSDVENVEVRCIFSTTSSVNLLRTVKEVYTESGIYEFEFEIGTDVFGFPNFSIGDTIKILAKYNYNSGTSAPYTGCQIEITDFVCKMDSLDEGDFVLLQDFLPEMKQLDFLKEFLKQYNCLIDIDENNKIYIDPRNDVFLEQMLSTNTETIEGIYKSEFDITKYVSEIQENEFEIFDKRFYLLSNDIELNEQIERIKYIYSKPDKFYDKFQFELEQILNEETENYKVNFKLYLDTIDFFQFTGQTLSDYQENWDLSIKSLSFIDLVAPITDSTYMVFNAPYINEDASSSSVDYFWLTIEDCRFPYIAPYFFSKTIEQLKLKRITKATLKVNPLIANKINFRTKLILDNQYYQLNKLNYDLEKQLMKVELILI